MKYIIYILLINQCLCLWKVVQWKDKKKTEKKVSVIRKYHLHTLQTNPRHHEEEPQNIYSNKTSVKQ